MGYIAVTYTFTNGTTASASQVNQNFTDLLNGLSDGTKNLNVSALTTTGAASLGSSLDVTGATTLNGNVTLGNATSDDVAHTGSMASSIPIKTTYSYDIGSATIGLRSIYLGSSDGAARSTRIIGGTVASSWTLTLPTSGGTNLYSLTTNGSGTTSWTSPAVIQSLTITASKTSTYTAAVGELVLCNATSGSFTVNLPSASGITGQRIVVKRTDSTLANAVTIDGSGTETIDGALTRLICTQYEMFDLVSNGTNWIIADHVITSLWTSYTPSLSAGFGTTSNVSFFYKRDGANIFVRGSFTTGTVAAMPDSISLPSGLSIDTGKISIANTTANPGAHVGNYFQNNGISCAGPIVTATGTSTTLVYLGTNTTSTAMLNPTAAQPMASSQVVSMNFMVPISNWEG